MARGRPPKPTALKELEGTLRQDRVISNEMMPSKISYAPSPPEMLSDLAKTEWQSAVEELIAMDMLHRVDLPLLAAYCQEMASYLEAVEIIRDEGATMEFFKEDGSKYSQQSPWVGIKNTCLKNAQSIASQFGFTPSARTRISSPAKKDSIDPFEAAMKMA